jgi:hypothetical protein
MMEAKPGPSRAAFFAEQVCKQKKKVAHFERQIERMTCAACREPMSSKDEMDGRDGSGEEED